VFTVERGYIQRATADSVNNNIVWLFSYNSRGFNDSKRCYLSSVLSKCDILLLQEHWLSDDLSSCLSTLSSDHVAVGVSEFGVLSGRPYGGCAVIWRSSLNLLARPIITDSGRICAVLFSNDCIKLLCACVYMPYEKDDSSMAEFQYQLSVIDSLMEQYSDCHVM